MRKSTTNIDHKPVEKPENDSLRSRIRNMRPFSQVTFQEPLVQEKGETNRQARSRIAKMLRGRYNRLVHDARKQTGHDYQTETMCVYDDESGQYSVMYMITRGQ